MLTVITERIWTQEADELVPRAGEVVLDSVEDIDREVDTHGPLYVSRGLEIGDVAVFLAFYSNDIDSELPDQTIGYLVSQVDTDDGSGIIVGGYHFENRPADWVNDRITDTWQSLNANGYSPDDFELHSLTRYLASLSK